MSLEQLLAHRRIWTDKPVLARIYGVWFNHVLEALPRASRVVEVGAGPGFLAEHARKTRPDLRWLASDLFGTSWNDLAADALRLPIRSASVDAVVGIDFIHHLAQPAEFFREARRVLVPSGCVVAVEPWITVMSYPVYRFLHHELCRLSVDPWQPFPDGRGKDAFDGDSALPHAILKRTRPEAWRELGFAPPETTLLNAFAYLLSLGFKPGCLLPRGAASAALAFDSGTRPLARWLALRARLLWRPAP